VAPSGNDAVGAEPDAAPTHFEGGSDSSGTGGAESGSSAPDTGASDASLPKTGSVDALQTSAAPSGGALAAASSAVEPSVEASSPASSSTPSLSPPLLSPSFGTPTFGAAVPALSPAQLFLRHWSAPNALIVLARDVKPGVHSIRAKHSGHATTFAVGFASPLATKGAHRPFRAGGWLRSDQSGVTVCVRAVEVFKQRTIRTSESCSVAHRKWHRVDLHGESLATGHRLLLSVYEFGASNGDSFDVGGFRVSQS
jgi:hypothetical protein